VPFLNSLEVCSRRGIVQIHVLPLPLLCGVLNNFLLCPPVSAESHAMLSVVTVLHCQVEVEVEAMDKGGNFIGWLYIDGVNLSVALVEEGLAKVHFTAERSSHAKSLQHAETKAKESKLNVSNRFVNDN